MSDDLSPVPQSKDLLVINALNDWTCASCSGTGDLLKMQDEGPLCMTCADLDHLVFLPRGNATLTRRARKASTLSAVVVRFSRARQRYERQGVLVEEPALTQAEAECLADADARALRRAREEQRRDAGDVTFQAAFAEAIQRLYPGCPAGRARQIAEHTAVRGSGRVGRSTAGRNLDSEAISLAVAAAIRHNDTPYDSLLMSGVDRSEARRLVRDDVEGVLQAWAAEDLGHRPGEAPTPTLDESSGGTGGRAGFETSARAVRADRDTR